MRLKSWRIEALGLKRTRRRIDREDAKSAKGRQILCALCVFAVTYFPTN